MRPLRQRVPDVDDVSAAAGERLTTRDQSTRCRPGDSLASERQRIARRSFSRGFELAVVDAKTLQAANASSFAPALLCILQLELSYISCVTTNYCPLKERLQRASALIVVRAATANRHTRRTRCCHHAHAPPYHRYNKCSGPAAANHTKKAAHATAK